MNHNEFDSSGSLEGWQGSGQSLELTQSVCCLGLSSWMRCWWGSHCGSRRELWSAGCDCEAARFRWTVDHCKGTL